MRFFIFLIYTNYLLCVDFFEDLIRFHGDLTGMHIVEINGDGSLFHRIQDCGFASYTFAGAKPEIEGANIFYADENVFHYDIVIASNPFEDSEFTRKLIQSCPRGYLSFEDPQVINHKWVKKVQGYGTLIQDGNKKRLFWRNGDPVSGLAPIPKYSGEGALTYSFSGGRFGDNLIAYLHARWAAFKLSLPFLTNPFLLSNALSLAGDGYSENFDRIVSINTLSEIDSSKTLWIVPYFPDTPFEMEHQNLKGMWFQPDWDDRVFQKDIRKSLEPSLPVATIKPPKGVISIAVHMRLGGGVDPAHYKLIWPLKFPPFSYYVEALKETIALFPGKPIYIFLFTDDQNPGQIAACLKRTFQNYPIKFGYRPENSPSMNILEDFYSFRNFDCLIRAQSNYSLAGGLLKDFKVQVAPVHAQIVNGEPFIDGVEVKFFR